MFQVVTRTRGQRDGTVAGTFASKHDAIQHAVTVMRRGIYVSIVETPR